MLVTLVVFSCEKDCSANRPKHNHRCRRAVDGLIDGCSSEREVDEPSANVEKGVEKGEEKCVKQSVVKHG